jgi:hypothetical protein
MAEIEKPAPQPAFANAPDEAAFKASRVVATGTWPDPAKFGVEECCVREYWAVIESDGSLARGRNVVRTEHLGPGQYMVTFTGDVSKGVFVATLGQSGIGTTPSGQIGVATRFYAPDASWYLPFESLGMPNTDNHAVWIDTHDSNGNFADRSFHLLVMTQQ